VPEVRLLDARDHDLDETGLRARARALTDAAGARYAARSYRFPWAMVAWHARPVGIDLERIDPVDRAFAESIVTPGERAELAAHDDELDTWVADLWSSKEALAKALGDAVLYDPRRLESPMRWPGFRAGPWRALAVAGVPPGHVGWVCWEGSGGERRSGLPAMPAHVAMRSRHVHRHGDDKDGDRGGDRPPDARCDDREADEQPGTDHAREHSPGASFGEGIGEWHDGEHRPTRRTAA
jgi:hypothetical protein